MSNLTGITNEMVADANSVEEVWNRSMPYWIKLALYHIKIIRKPLISNIDRKTDAKIP